MCMLHVCAFDCSNNLGILDTTNVNTRMQSSEFAILGANTQPTASQCHQDMLSTNSCADKGAVNQQQNQKHFYDHFPRFQQGVQAYLKGSTHEMKRGRRKPSGANMAVACRIVLAAACWLSSGCHEVDSKGSRKASDMSFSSLAVKNQPHAVCAEAFVMPCTQT